MKLLITKTIKIEDLSNYQAQLRRLKSRLDLKEESDRIITSRKNNRNYYYRVSKDNKKKYLSIKETSTIKKLLQNTYETKLLKETNRELHAINHFLKRAQKFNLEHIYSKLDVTQKKLITPYAVSNEDYAQVWSASPYNSAPRIITEFITSKGEYVKSKSEVIIADTLASMNIPYRYEPVFVTKDGVTKYPDFQLLDTKTRKEYYHEHFGMMDDPDYLRSAINKIDTYAKNGIILGVNFIATFESSEHPLNRNTLKSTLSAVFNHN